LTDIFHEVEEDLRRDKLNQLWKRYGTLFLTVAVLAVAGTSGVVLWRQYEANKAAAAATAFSAAADKAIAGDLDGSLAAYEAIAAEGGEGYPVLALFREAELRLAKGDLQGTIAVYDRIGQSPADPRLKTLARVRAAYLVADIESPDVLKNRVADFLGADNPWRFSAREIHAWADYRAGRVAEAAEAYAALAADPGTPAGVKARAEKLSVYIKGGGTIPLPPKPVEAAPAAPVASPAETTTPDSTDPATPPAGAQDR
jgi:hypothetical protein